MNINENNIYGIKSVFKRTLLCDGPVSLYIDILRAYHRKTIAVQVRLGKIFKKSRDSFDNNEKFFIVYIFLNAKKMLINSY